VPPWLIGPFASAFPERLDFTGINVVLRAPHAAIRWQPFRSAMPAIAVALRAGRSGAFLQEDVQASRPPKKLLLAWAG
jgi:hypothetical protein